MDTFYARNPNDAHETNAKLRDWEQAQAEKAKKEKQEKTRFIVTASLSGIAALAAVAGVIVQLVSAR
jgi:hypothetical protein